MFDVQWMLAAIGFVAVAVPATSAPTFQRTMTCDPGGGIRGCEPGEDPKPIAWPTRCVQYRINEDGTSQFSRPADGTIGDELETIVHRSFETWNEPSCTDFKLVAGELTSTSAAEFERDAGWTGNENIVVWRDDQWVDKSASAYAVTSVSHSSTGIIGDADVEVNTKHHDFAHFQQSQVDDATEIDIENTLTHEVGHFLGLAHSADPEATMFGDALAGEIKKRTLRRDDIDGLCTIYSGKKRRDDCVYPKDFVPPAAEKKTEAKGCGCQSAGGSLPLSALFVGMFFACSGFCRMAA